MAASQQLKVDNQPLAFSHHKAVVHPWECWNEFLVTGCSSWRQPARIREETHWDLTTSSAEEICLNSFNFRWLFQQGMERGWNRCSIRQRWRTVDQRGVPWHRHASRSPCQQQPRPLDGSTFGRGLVVGLREWWRFSKVIFLTRFLYQAICTQRTRRVPSNRRLYEHGIYIRHCQESNSTKFKNSNSK